MTAVQFRPVGGLAVVVAVDDAPETGTLWFGDDHSMSISAATRSIKHVYQRPGAYTITVTDGTGSTVAVDRCFVRTGTVPKVTWVAGDDNPNFIDFTWDDEPADLISFYDVVWGDSSDPAVVAAPPGHVASHGYDAGSYTVQIYDRQSARWGRYDITVTDKTYDPDLAVRQGDSSYEVVATITRLGTAGKPVNVWWGDGTNPNVIASPQVGTEVTHTYGIGDTYMVQVAYADGSGDGGAAFVEIPWPDSRGPKPTSQLVWSPEPTAALSVRAKWWGSGWDYTMHWGDGNQQRVRWQDPPVQHTYEQAGAYTVTAVSDLHADWAASALVVVRDAIGPQFTASHLGDGLVQVDVTEVADPVDMRVNWSTGTEAERIPAGQWQAQHQYRLGSPRPTITVTDVPAKRVKRVLGPVIPPPPIPAETGLLAWHDIAGSRINGTLKGARFKPGEQLTAMFVYSTERHFRDVTCNSQGRFSVDYRYEFTPGRYPWRSIHVKRADQHGGTGRVAVSLPVLLLKTLASQTLSLGFDWVFEDPYLIRALVHAPKPGEYTVDWGDGTADTVACDGWVLDAQHRYQDSGPFSVTVTDPTGVTETRGIGSTSHREPGWGVSGIDGTSPNGMLWIGIEGTSGQQFPAMKPRWGMLRDWQYDDYLYVADNPRTSWSNGYDYYGHPGEQATLQLSSPLSDLYERTVTLPHPKSRNFDRIGPGVLLMPPVDGSVSVNGWWRLVTPWDGGRTGEIRMRNTTGTVLSDGWVAEFDLPEGATVVEVWPEPENQVFDLGDGRWAVSSTKAVQPEKQGVVSMRIEHPGIEEVKPAAITVTAVRNQ